MMRWLGIAILVIGYSILAHYTNETPPRGNLGALVAIAPLVLLTLGIGGAWVSNVTALEPLRPWFLAATVLLLGAGFVWLRREDQRACEPGSVCASPTVRRRMRLWLWIATAIAIPFATFPWWSKFVLS